MEKTERQKKPQPQSDATIAPQENTEPVSAGETVEVASVWVPALVEDDPVMEEMALLYADRPDQLKRNMT